jgi:hypothetical protein
MIGPSDLFHPSPAPHFKTFQLFLFYCPKRPGFSSRIWDISSRIWAKKKEKCKLIFHRALNDFPVIQTTYQRMIRLCKIMNF